VRLRLQRIAAVLVVGVAILTMLRGTGTFAALHRDQRVHSAIRTMRA
jgi:hypothetical protein